MKILYIEPYYDGSHKQWINSYREHSSHQIDIISLKGSKWKWRMHGGAITLAREYNRLKKKYDLILCSDFLNLPVFLSICKEKIKYIPVIMYFHENQASYPWSPNDQDITLERDFHYYYINQTSSLVSHQNLFNSQYHFDSYIDGLKTYLNKMPDNKNLETLDIIKNKSSVLYLGCDLKKYSKKTKESSNKKPIILWNHRWEFDKNPDLFFKTLIKLKNDGMEYSLVVLGEEFSNSPEIFNHAREALSKEILHIGYCESYDDYKDWLWKSDILPVTSIQDFFGVSIMEAIYSNTYPILPERLSYTELFNINLNPEIFYKNDSELYNKLKFSIENYSDLPSYSSIAEKFDWLYMASEYDNLFEKLQKSI